MKINISLPDDLHHDLQLFKGSLNVSRICQAALAEKLAEEKARIIQSISEIERHGYEVRKK